MKWLVGIEGILSKSSIIPFMHLDHEQLAKYCPLNEWTSLTSRASLDLGSCIRFPECTVSHTKEVIWDHTNVHHLDPLSIHMYTQCLLYDMYTFSIHTIIYTLSWGVSSTQNSHRIISSGGTPHCCRCPKSCDSTTVLWPRYGSMGKKPEANEWDLYEFMW